MFAFNNKTLERRHWRRSTVFIWTAFPFFYCASVANLEQIIVCCTAHKMKFSIKDFFSKCDQIRIFLRIWSYLLKKSLMENFIFRAVLEKIISWTQLLKTRYFVSFNFAITKICFVIRLTEDRITKGGILIVLTIP